MTYEEAIKHFKSLQKRYTKEHNGRMCEKVALALEAMEKQVPKKPIDNHHCPSCETGLPHKGFTDEWCKCCFELDYCPRCGQAIDWR